MLLNFRWRLIRRGEILSISDSFRDGLLHSAVILQLFLEQLKIDRSVFI